MAGLTAGGAARGSAAPALGPGLGAIGGRGAGGVRGILPQAVFEFGDAGSETDDFGLQRVH
jgi:hypothetical protein